MLVYISGGLSESAIDRVAQRVRAEGHTPTLDPRHADAIAPADWTTYRFHSLECRVVLPIIVFADLLSRAAHP
jgi:hypothetical protein